MINHGVQYIHSKMANVSDPVCNLVRFPIDMIDRVRFEFSKEDLNFVNDHWNLPRGLPNTLD